MIYFQLFLSFLQIGALSFGGGYAAMPLIQNQVVHQHLWLSMSEFSDLVTISQMTPGPIAINAATFVGLKTAGILGAIVATIGCILPSCIIVTIITYFYMKYRHLDFLQKILKVLRPVVIALIATAGISILVSAFFPYGIISINTLQIQMVVIFVICCVLLIKYHMNPIAVMILSGLMNILCYYMI